MLIFLPADYTGSTASGGVPVTSIEAGTVMSGEQIQVSVLLGNLGNEAINYELVADEPEVEILSPDGTIEPDQISDTIVFLISAGIYNVSFKNVAIITSNGQHLKLKWNQVAINEKTNIEFPDRISEETTVATKLIDRLSEPLNLQVYTPLAVDQNSTYIYSYKGLGLKQPRGASDIFFQSDENISLNPLNWKFGYAKTTENILCSFSAEQTEFLDSYDIDTIDNFTARAKLIVAADVNLEPTFALFSEKTDLEPTLYKKTVCVIQRGGHWWYIHKHHKIYKGNEYHHQECELRRLHNRYAGSTSGINPFAYLYAARENETKPYMNLATVQIPDEFWDAMEDPYGS